MCTAVARFGKFAVMREGIRCLMAMWAVARIVIAMGVSCMARMR